MDSEIFNDVIDRFKLNNTYPCQFFGVRSTYGLLPDFRESTLSKRITEIKRDVIEVEKLLNSEKNELGIFEKKLVLQALNSEIFSLEVIKPHKKLIGAYAEPISNIITVYVSRSYDSIDIRIKDIISHEKSIPGFLSNGLVVLDRVLPKPILRMGVGALTGINAFLKSELESFVNQSHDTNLIAEWKETNEQAIKSIDNFITKLKDDFLPVSTTDFKLGEKQFLDLVEASEGIKVTTEQLLKIAEKDLDENYKQMELMIKKNKSSILDEINNDIPTPDNLIEECQKIVNETKSYLKKSDLMTVPTDQDCKVVETPEFRRSFSIASMNLPGLAEPSNAKETYYYITKPDPKWDQEQTANFMKNFARGSLHVTTIHEVFPGHFIQGQYFQNVITSPIIRLFSFTVSIIEGWAHYGEELIVNHGYDRYDKTKIKIGQLLGALKRNVRFICAVKMHCQNMTVEEAKELFKEKAFLSEESAQMEAMRGTVDPLYLNYTLGKLMIKKLKNDVKKEQGRKFKEKDFHDTILKLGGPPILLLREFMLKKTPIEDFL